MLAVGSMARIAIQMTRWTHGPRDPALRDTSPCNPTNLSLRLRQGCPAHMVLSYVQDHRCHPQALASSTLSEASMGFHFSARGASFDSEEISEVTGGTSVRSGSRGTICTDSRTLQPGDWFLPLRGANYDGHAFLPQAAQAGCAGIIAEVAPSGWSSGYVKVDNTLDALHKLASAVRNAISAPVVAITGSTGKTSTRAMIALALESLGVLHQTKENFNNHVGLPLTLLAMTGVPSACVLELGMNHSGEIADLAAIARPTIRVILNVGPVHLEGLGSVVAVARAKGELFDTARLGDICIANGDDALVAALPVPEGVTRVTFGSTPDCFLQVLSIERVDGGRAVRAHLAAPGPPGQAHLRQEGEVYLRSPGSHLVENACAAAAVAVALGVPLCTALVGIEKHEPVGMRMRLEDVRLGRGRRRGDTEVVEGMERVNGRTLEPGTGADGDVREGRGEVEGRRREGCEDVGDVLCLINDAYNANPMSVHAGLEVLKGLECGEGGRRIALLGDMLELGSFASEAHSGVLERAAELGIDIVGVAGDLYLEATTKASVKFDKKVTWVAKSSMELRDMVVPGLRGGDVVLVKGSRGMKMEIVCVGITRLSMQ